MKDEFSVGVLVQLACKGPALVVVGVFKKVVGGTDYRVVWFDEKNRLQEATLPGVALQLYVADEEWREG